MSRKAKILIVDDEEDILEFLHYNLNKEGYNVEVAQNGIEGLKKAKIFKPDLIILDIMMPEMDGMEVCNFLRQDKSFDNTLIAFLTARNEDYTQISALEKGGDDYISKPIKPGVFISRVKALLRRAGIQDKNEDLGIISVSDLTIDRNKYVVLRGNTEVTFAKKEFELLYLLASKPGKVFKRLEILNTIWGTDVIVGNRTIDVHIRKIREKLGNNYIQTVKGVGYKFVF